MIQFNIPPYVGNENENINKAILDNKKICGDGPFTKMCNTWLERKTRSPKVLLTTSCTHALEMAAILLNIQPGDEVISPSFTFVSTVNAFILRGAKVVFVDIRPDTMNIDENLIERAVTNKTKVIVPVHYAGVACEMSTIMQVANSRNIPVIEDAAQAVMASYNGKALGSIGSLGCFSFHETKNYSMGEGGALLINNSCFHERAEIIREKGTNRSKYISGQIDKYTWVDIGSSYLPSELNAAYLYAQLEVADEINANRLSTWEKYYLDLKPLQNSGKIVLPFIPNGCLHNAHMFYIKCKNISERISLMQYLRDKGVSTAFHYIPLHSSPCGKIHGCFSGEDVYTTLESERLLRLPMYYGLTDEQRNTVISSIFDYYKYT